MIGWACGSLCTAQPINPPPIKWQASFGGTGADSPSIIQPTHDGGWIIGGKTYSAAGGNKSSPAFGQGDVWLIKLDASGVKLWDATFGGTGQDDFGSSQPNVNLRALLPTDDGGFVFGNTSFSGASGNKTSVNHGISDYWVVRMDSNANKVWDRSYGGTSSEELQTVLPVAGGFLIAGTSYSSRGGNKACTNAGLGDYWILRVDADGEILWQQSIGGPGNDVLKAAVTTAGDGLLLAGSYGLVQLDATGQQLWHVPLEGGLDLTGVIALQPCVNGGFFVGYSRAHSPTTNRHDTDYSVMRVDAGGHLIWTGEFGGNNEDTLTSLVPQPDGGALLGGFSYSGIGGTKTGTNFGWNDYWLVRVDGTGNQLWDRSFGGSNYDKLYYLVPTADGGVILAGNSGSVADGNKTSPKFGGNDIWLVRLDANGGKLWEQTFGGTGYEGFAHLQRSSDGGSIFCAQSDSLGTSGNKFTTNWGANDFWVVKLDADDVSRPPRLLATIQSYEDIRTIGFHFSFSTLSNQTHQVEHSSDMETWSPLEPELRGAGNSDVLDAGASDHAQRFYRVKRLP